MAGEKLQIGFITRAHGIRGMVRVRATSQALLHLERVFLGGREVKLERVEPERDEFLVQLEGVRDRNQAEALRGSTLEVYRGDLPQPADDQVFVADLIGCRVVDLSGAALGEVVDTFYSGAHEVLVIRGAREFMLPFIDQMVTSVDVLGKLIVCDPPPGLIDLDEAEPG